VTVTRAARLQPSSLLSSDYVLGSTTHSVVCRTKSCCSRYVTGLSLGALGIVDVVCRSLACSPYVRSFHKSRGEPTGGEREPKHRSLLVASPLVVRVPLNAVNGPVLVHYLVVLTGLQTS
jgi:hypothetical protein